MRTTSPAATAADLGRQVIDVLDDLLPVARYRSRRAITIVAQPSARTTHPEGQDLHRGPSLAFVPRPSERTVFGVADVVVEEWLLWRTPDRSRPWRPVPLTEGRTRLQAVHQWSRPLVLVTVLLLEVGSYPMMRRMLRGIRGRVEAEHRRRAALPSGGSSTVPLPQGDGGRP